jgi:tetratricopeptide (TPR) repeat protein
MKAMKRIPLALTLALVMSLPLAAQDADESALDQFDQAKVARPAYDSPASVELRDAVRRMAARPNDPVALADAGHASLKLGDAAAALNFFNRANSLQPGNVRTVSGLGSAMVRTENPFEALRYFDEAVRLGANERSIALDRALAFDLLGNFDRAHKDYQLAKSFGSSDELTRRYAMSLSMAGQASEADGLLVPLLQRNDPEAWRARSMMLAARGEIKEAVQITQGFLSADAARRMEGFLRQMPRMTDAQRAAAMHFGHFPVGRIGEDTAEIRRVAAANPQPKVASAATGQDRLIPAGAPLGGTDKKASTKKDEKKPKTDDRRLAKAEPRPGFSTTTAQQKVEQAAKAKPVVLAAANLPPPDTARAPVKVILPGPTIRPPVAAAVVKTEVKPETLPATAPVIAPPPDSKPIANNTVTPSGEKPAPAALPPVNEPVITEPQPTASPPPQNIPASVPAENSVRVAAVDNSGAAPPTATSASAAPQGPLPDGGSLPPAETRVAVATPSTPAPAPQPGATAAFDLDALVRSIEIPESEQQQKVAAVDLKAIQRAQAKADAEAAAKEKAKKPSEPARLWVQVATGAEAALGGDYRRLARKSPELFKGKEGWTTPWGRSSRLLVGPFADNKSAKKWEADFRKEGGSGFVWQSENGTAVKKLGAK